MESNDADFSENRFIFKSRNRESSGSSSLTLDRNPIRTEEVDPKFRRSKRTRTVKDIGDDFQTCNVEKDP